MCSFSLSAYCLRTVEEKDTGFTNNFSACVCVCVCVCVCLSVQWTYGDHICPKTFQSVWFPFVQYTTFRKPQGVLSNECVTSELQ